MIRTAKFGALVAAVALASACSSSTGGTTGTVSSGTTSGSTSGTGTGTGTTSGSSGTSGTTGTVDAGVNCNGIEFVTDAGAGTAGTDVFLADYPKSDDIRDNCTTALIDPYLDAGAVLWNLSGVLDVNTNVVTGTIYTVWPAGCDDLDAGAAPTAGPVVVDGGTTIAATLVAGKAGSATTFTGPIYGVVTFISGPYSNDTGGHSGTMWIQDPVATGDMPVANSGVEIYFPKASANDAGATSAGLYPATGSTRGDVVALTNLKWDPYKAEGNTTGQNQNELEFGTTSTMTVLGQGTLPPAVPLTATQIQSEGATYAGMRVVQTDGPDTVVNACPLPLQSPVE